MFGKITSHQVRRNFNNVKKFLGHAPHLVKGFQKAYHTTRDVLNSIDDGVATAKTVYKDVVAPTIKAVAGNDGIIGKINTGIEKSLNQYDQIRDRITSGHDAVISNIENVKGNLMKKTPKIKV